jgi:type II secretory pathway predicted ATPase ExeA
MTTLKNESILEEALHHWGANTMPFVEGADGEPFLTDPMKEALELLQQTAALRSVMLLSGANGVGKSALATHWGQHLEQKRFVPIVITHATLSGTGLLCCLLGKLGQRPGMRRSDNIERIDDAVRRLGRTIPVIILDEAQHYTASAMEEMRLLLGLNLPKHPLFALILIGDNYLLDTLRLHSRRALYSRISAAHQLQPLAAEQVEPYLQHRLAQAGIHRQCFDQPALEMLTVAADGIPRSINLLASSALIEAARHKANTIGAEHLQIAIKRVPMAQEKVALPTS